MLKMKLQYFGQLMWRALEKTLEMNTHLHECRYEHAFTCIIGKDSDAGEDWRQEKKGMTEDEMGGWHHWLNGDKFEQALVLVMGSQRVRHDCDAKVNCLNELLVLCKMHRKCRPLSWLVVFTDRDLGTGVEEKKAMKRRTRGTQVSSETRVLYSWQHVRIYCYTRKL